MNSDLFDQLRKLKLPIGEYAVFGSGPLGIRNIRYCGDLDLIVKEPLFNKLKTMPGWEYEIFRRDDRQVELIRYGKIEIFKKWEPGNWNIPKLINEADIIDNLPFVKLEEVRKYKKISGREKDLRDMELIDGYLKKSQQ
jgi:hypothetical protein